MAHAQARAVIHGTKRVACVDLLPVDERERLTRGHTMPWLSSGSACTPVAPRAAALNGQIGVRGASSAWALPYPVTSSEAIMPAIGAVTTGTSASSRRCSAIVLAKRYWLPSNAGHGHAMGVIAWRERQVMTWLPPRHERQPLGAFLNLPAATPDTYHSPSRQRQPPLKAGSIRWELRVGGALLSNPDDGSPYDHGNIWYRSRKRGDDARGASVDTLSGDASNPVQHTVCLGVRQKKRKRSICTVAHRLRPDTMIAIIGHA